MPRMRQYLSTNGPWDQLVRYGNIVLRPMSDGVPSQHARFEVSRSGLTIIGDFYGRTIPVQSLVADRAMRIDLSGDSVHRPRIRTFGTGLPGYSSG